MINKKKKTLIIAEAGVNHNGEIKIAKKLIDLASQAGADYIKFQSFKTENLVTKNAMKAKYQIRNNNKSDRSQFKMLKKLELSRKDHIQLINYCKKRKIKFLSSVFDIESFNLLNDLNQKIIKIPSSEINNIPLLRYISKFKKKLIVSTGMSSLLDIKKNIKILTKNIINISDISVLHCISSYPTLDSDVNLKVMSTLKKAFKCRIGYSDHTEGIEIPIAAVALGAEIIEKHFTLSKHLSGPDHKVSLDSNEFKTMVHYIRNVEKALGSNKKAPMKSEMKNYDFIRKSIVAKRIIKKGDIFSEKNLTVKRPGNGISPLNWDKLIGKKSEINYKPDMLIKW